MGAVTYRFDYAKFLFHVKPHIWNLTSQRIHALAHEMKVKGEWLKSHKTTRLWYNQDADMETWSLEIWGEWAQVVSRYPPDWVPCLKRLDVRAILWDVNEEAIIEVGQHLQKNLTRYNVNVYSTKPRTKRDGRDAGGKGFSIGSHKSDLRVTCYKRSGEPCAQEFQCSGALLARHYTEVMDLVSGAKGTIDPWNALNMRIQASGTRRMADAFNSANLATHWPTWAPVGADNLVASWPEDDSGARWSDAEQQSTFGDDVVLPADQL